MAHRGSSLPYYGTEEEQENDEAISHQAVLEEEGYQVDKGNGGPASEQLEEEEERGGGEEGRRIRM